METMNQTSQAVAILPGSAVVATQEQQARVADMLANARAVNTVRAYQSDMRDFVGFCQRQGTAPAIPARPETVALYLDDMVNVRGLAISTAQRRLAALSQAHNEAGADNPVEHAAVRLAWRGLRRQIGTAPKGKAPLVADDIARMVAALPPTTAGLRNRALLLLGFAGGFRRSELVNLNMADVEFTPRGVTVTLRRSKTDQEGAGRVVGIHTEPDGSALCPVAALRAWLATAGVADGPVFRAVHRSGRVLGGLSGRDVARIVQAAATSTGLDASAFAGHSLRAGFVTQAHLDGTDQTSIMATTGHRSDAMVRRYIRHADPYTTTPHVCRAR